MCGRFTLTDPERLITHYSRYRFPDLRRSFNVAPTHEVAALCDDAGDAVAMLQWGVPGRHGGLVVNARSETVAAKPLFRDAFRSQRCVVFADSYYEWMSDVYAKRPFRFTLQGGEPFAFAALWYASTSRRRTVCLLTTAPNERQRLVHDRSPVILRDDDIGTWLNRETPEPRLLELCGPISPNRIHVCEVSSLVNNVNQDDERCIAPFTPPEVSLFAGL
jgi:putative SOS response-associated peptidase YedK